MVRVAVENSAVGRLSGVELENNGVKKLSTQAWDFARTYVFLLLVNVTDLEPNIFLGQWARRVINNVLKALDYKLVIESLGGG